MPLVWGYQLLSNLLIRELYFQNNNDEYIPQTKKSLFSFLKSFIYFNLWKNKKIKPKTPISISKSDILTSKKSKIKNTINKHQLHCIYQLKNYIIWYIY